LVFAALNPARDIYPLPHRYALDVPRVPPPRDTRYVVRFIIGAVDRQKYIANLALERRRAVDWRLANITFKLYLIGAYRRGVKQVAHKNRQHKAAFPARNLVITAELPVKRYFAALLYIPVGNQPFA